MKPITVMLIAGEPSGDAHAAGLVEALRQRWTTGLGLSAQPALAPRFFGGGGPRMAAAGVEIVVDLAAHAVFGLAEVVRDLRKFGRFLRQLLDLACVRQPDVIVLVDYAGFNRRFAAGLRRRLAGRRGPFANWSPAIVYFISPQVWASREGRADQLARDVDLLLTIFPFEKPWYARRVPTLPVEFVGHPIADRPVEPRRGPSVGEAPHVLLLPGSRVQEIRRHLPVMIRAVRIISRQVPIRVTLHVPDGRLLRLVMSLVSVTRVEGWTQAPPAAPGQPNIGACMGRLSELLAETDLALAKSGSVTLECAWFRVPAVVLYRVAWPTWLVARRLVRVPHVAMPNLLAGKRVYPELLQSAATPEGLARAALELLRSSDARQAMVAELERVRSALGSGGAYRRAAEAIVRLLVELRWNGPPPTGTAAE